MEIILLLIMGWAVVGVVVGIYEFGWSLLNLMRYPVEFVAAIISMAAGILICRYMGWI